MNSLHQLLLGAGLLVASPNAEGQLRTDYTGTWLNTAPYTHAVAKLEVSRADRWAPSLTAWEGLPASPTRRPMGYLWSRPSADGTVNRLGLRRVTADVAETYLLDLQPDGSLWVLHHVAQAGRAVRCDTMRFERRHARSVGRHRAHRPVSPPEVALHFAPSAPMPTEVPTLLALRLRP